MFTSKFFAPVLAAAVMSATSAYAAPRVEPNHKGGEVIDLTKPSPRAAPESTPSKDGELNAEAGFDLPRPCVAGGVIFGTQSRGLGDNTKRVRADAYTLGLTGKASYFCVERESEFTLQDIGLTGSLEGIFRADHYRERINQPTTALTGRFVVGPYAVLRLGNTYLEAQALFGTTMSTEGGYQGAEFVQRAIWHLKPRSNLYDITMLRSEFYIRAQNEVRGVGRKSSPNSSRQTAEVIWVPFDAEWGDIGFGPLIEIDQWKEPIEPMTLNANGDLMYGSAWGVNAGGRIEYRHYGERPTGKVFGIGCSAGGGGTGGFVACSLEWLR